MKAYLQKRYKLMIVIALIIGIYNLYFIFLLQIESFQYLLYIDFLLVIGLGLGLTYDWYRWLQRAEQKTEMLAKDMVIYDQLSGFPDLEIAQHDVTILQKNCRCKKQLQKIYKTIWLNGAMKQRCH